MHQPGRDESIVDNPEEFSALMNVHVFAPYWINTQCQTLLEANDGVTDVISLTDFTVTKEVKSMRLTLHQKQRLRV